MAPFYGWGSTASRLEPLRGGSLLFTTKFPEVPGTHKLCYIDTDSFIVHIKTDDIYKNIADVETRFDTSNFEIDRPLLKGYLRYKTIFGHRVVLDV